MDPDDLLCFFHSTEWRSYSQPTSTSALEDEGENIDQRCGKLNNVHQRGKEQHGHCQDIFITNCYIFLCGELIKREHLETFSYFQKESRLKSTFLINIWAQKSCHFFGGRGKTQTSQLSESCGQVQLPISIPFESISSIYMLNKLFSQAKVPHFFRSLTVSSKQCYRCLVQPHGHRRQQCCLAIRAGGERRPRDPFAECVFISFLPVTQDELKFSCLLSLEVLV